MRGARITVRCDCGEIQYVPYGERWECPKCGRRWNTAQIPSEEYWGIMREMRQERLRIMALAIVVGVGFAAFAIANGPRTFALAPVVLGVWLLFVMPRWRRRLRARARSLPTWKLKPE